MRTSFLTKIGAATFTLLIACGALTGCVEKDVYNPELGKPEVKPESDYFDFATTTNVDFEVNYGKMADGALLEIYTEAPIIYENGSYSIKGEANYKIFADENGRFKGKVELPGTTKKVYIYSPSWGAPMCVEANVENGKVTVDETKNKATVTRATATRANEKLEVWEVDDDDNLYSIVEWTGIYGKITDSDKVTSEGSLKADDIKKIQYSLWKGDTAKPEGLNNSSLVTDTKKVNATIAQTYINNEDKTINIEDAEVWLTFLSESAWHQNSIGYYYYPSDKVPTSADGVKKYILFPNASISGNVPYMEFTAERKDSYYDFGRENAPLVTNTKIQLLYTNEKGEVSTRFPPGYTIGYFLMPKEYSNNNTANTYELPNTYIYSNNAWNNNKSHFISLSYEKTGIVYGIEDSNDKSYDDILFCIDAKPREAIQDPGRPVIDPEKPVITTTEIIYRTYAFEDTWPSGGDYDLNDVMIEHKQEVTLIDKNYVTKVVDTFIPTQRSDAAQFTNAFCVQYDAAQRGAIELPHGAIDETETSSVILLADAQKVRETAHIVTRTFTDKSLNKTDLKTDLNPFIIAQYVAGTDSRTEIHLPKAKATSKANQKLIGSKDDAYYIHKDGKYPFAVMIPLRSSEKEPLRFIPAAERTSIDKEFPYYKNWVESTNHEPKDWYFRD